MNESYYSQVSERLNRFYPSNTLPVYFVKLYTQTNRQTNGKMLLIIIGVKRMC